MLALSSITSACGSSLLNAFKASKFALSATFLNPVRFRYHEDKPEILERRWGYKDTTATEGPLPRVPTCKTIPMVYEPRNRWAERRAIFGQNDYIDILGDDDSISPVRFAYGVPSWLRGFRGEEYHVLLRKRQFLGPRMKSPTGIHYMKKRLKYLYRRMNYKTRSDLDARVFRR